MKETPKEQGKCQACLQLTGAEKYMEPHPDLLRDHVNDLRSMFGSFEETHYTCKVCGQKWLRETGRFGRGWIA